MYKKIPDRSSAVRNFLRLYRYTAGTTEIWNRVPASPAKAMEPPSGRVTVLSQSLIHIS